MDERIMPEDVGCSICLEILYEPITMPCKHKMCKHCYITNIKETSINCPFCKLRIGTWNRRAKDVNKLIDIELWNRIKKQYPDKVEERQKGISNSIDELLFHQEVTHQIASEGEIGKAFQLEIQNFEQENRVISEKERRKSQALILRIQREELSRRSNVHPLTPSENKPIELQTGQSNSQESPDFHGWPSIVCDEKETVSDNELSSEFLDCQKEIEDKIYLEKKDEEYAKLIQSQTESPLPSTSYNLPFVEYPKKPKVAQRLFEGQSDESISDIEDTQDIYGELPDLEIPKYQCDNTRKLDSTCLDKLSTLDYKKIDLNDFIDKQFITQQKDQLRILNQEKEDEKMAKELQRMFQEEDRKKSIITSEKILTRNSPLRAKNLKQTPSSAKRQLSIERFMCPDLKKKANPPFPK